MSARINKRKDNKKKILVVEDEPDKGSTFFFSLPKREATSENEKSTATATARK